MDSDWRQLDWLSLFGITSKWCHFNNVYPHPVSFQDPVNTIWFQQEPIPNRLKTRWGSIEWRAVIWSFIIRLPLDLNNFWTTTTSFSFINIQSSFKCSTLHYVLHYIFVFDCILSNFRNHMYLIYFISIVAINMKTIILLYREWRDISIDIAQGYTSHFIRMSIVSVIRRELKIEVTFIRWNN